jgi:D-proline reductase (dithiol) PrdB
MSYVRYIDKTREYYAGEGYAKPYRWAHFEEIPFAPLAKPLAQCRVGLATSSEMAILGDSGPWDDEEDPSRDVYALPTSTPTEKLYTKKEAFDRYETTLDDPESYLPINRLREYAEQGKIRGLAPRFQVIYSQYSQRKTMTVDAPAIVEQMREDGVDVALLTAI